jgi:hypothetical protein
MSQAIQTYTSQFLSLLPQVMTEKFYHSRKGTICWVSYATSELSEDSMHSQLLHHKETLNRDIKSSGFLKFNDSFYQCFLFSRPLKRQEIISLFSEFPESFVFFIKKNLRCFTATSIFFFGLKNEVFPDWVSKMTSKSTILLQEKIWVSCLKDIRNHLDFYQVFRESLKISEKNGFQKNVKKEEAEQVIGLKEEAGQAFRKKLFQINRFDRKMLECFSKVVEMDGGKCENCKCFTWIVNVAIEEKRKLGEVVGFIKEEMGKMQKIYKNIENSIKSLELFNS